MQGCDASRIQPVKIVIFSDWPYWQLTSEKEPDECPELTGGLSFYKIF